MTSESLVLERELVAKMKKIRDRAVDVARYLETLEVQALALIVAARANGAGADLLAPPLELMASSSLSGLTRDAARKELASLSPDNVVDDDSAGAVGIDAMKRAVRGGGGW